MRRFQLPFTLVVTIIAWLCAPAQDFSNKGKDFWVGYGYHQVMGAGNLQEMVLYFATDQVTTVTVSIPGLGYSKTYPNIPANTVFTSNPLPKGSPDARLTKESSAPEDKGIHITCDHPIVAYAHIYNSSVSGATILFPTNTLGKDYYSINYTNLSNFPDANCWFYVVACDTGTTTVEITPSANTINHPAGVPFTINMTQGQIFNVMGQFNGFSNGTYSGVDLTGSRIRSISSGATGCKRIAVFSGSGRISITCTGLQSSSDNYMVQAFPKNAWGKRFLTANTGGQMTKDIYRICVSDPSTIVLLNGAPIPYTLQNNFYYEIPPTPVPQKIEADKPITVAQYITSQGACGNGNPGDPEVIYLSPVEQNISRVLWNATSNYAISQHYYNVIIPNSGTAISSFRFDGNPVNPSLFVTHPQDANYAYLIQSISAGQHIIQSDSGFNAIAYGYGNLESYGYNAGTNVKDLYQFASIQNQYSTVNFPAGCKNSPFYFLMTFPYQPTQIIWNFFGLFPGVTQNSPVYDSTWFLNGRQLYRYKLSTPYTITSTGIYPIQVLAQSPTSDGCSGDQQIDYDLQVFDPPVADFSFTSNGCLADSVHFLGTANTGGRSVVDQSWSFGDGGSSSIQNPAHLYSSANSYIVKYSIITDIGCLSDTLAKTIVISSPPVAKFSVSIPGCSGLPVVFTDQSNAAGSTLAKWYWGFGDASPQVIATNGNPQAHIYNTTGTFTVTLKIEATSGCQSILYSQKVVISPKPLPDFSFTNSCLPSGLTQFTDQSTISNGTLTQWLWDFGDGGTSSSQNPVHNYLTAGPFNVTLIVTSGNGCAEDSSKIMDKVFAQPQAAFSSPSEVCKGSTINFIDQSTAPGSAVTQWLWDFGDGTTSTKQNPTKTYSGQNTYIVTLTVKSTEGCSSATTKKNVTVNSLPTPGFNLSFPHCLNKDITFTDASAANAGNIDEWTWDFGDGKNSAFTSASPFTHSYSATGTYIITLQVKTDKGCTSTIFSKQVIINPLPAANFGLPESCLNDPFSLFTDSSLISDGTQNLFTYQWNFNDPNANGVNPNTSALQNPQHRYTATGPYGVSETVTSNNGCSSFITRTFFVNGSIPVPSFTLQGDTSACSGSTINLTDNSIVNPGNVVKIEVYWDYTTDPAIKLIDDDPLPGKNYSHIYPVFSSPAGKTVTIRYVAYSGQTCVQYIDKLITLLAAPAVQFDAMQGVCKDVPAFQITQASVANGLPGAGTFSGPGVSSTGLFNPSAAGDGTHTIRYTYTANNGCSGYKDQTIEVYPVPYANAGPDKFVLEGGTVTLTPALNAGYPVTYSWTPVTWLDNPEIPTPKSSPLSDITYTLTVTSDNGCRSFDDVFVKVLKAPMIPNIFSPNNDGVHDKWDIPYLASYPGCTVDIYNRYGQLIYHSAGYDKPWDGTVNGKQVPVGTYYYIIDPKNGKQKMSGYVDVIR